MLIRGDIVNYKYDDKKQEIMVKTKTPSDKP